MPCNPAGAGMVWTWKLSVSVSTAWLQQPDKHGAGWTAANSVQHSYKPDQAVSEGALPETVGAAPPHPQHAPPVLCTWGRGCSLLPVDCCMCAMPGPAPWNPLTGRGGVCSLWQLGTGGMAAWGSTAPESGAWQPMVAVHRRGAGGMALQRPASSCCQQ